MTRDSPAGADSKAATSRAVSEAFRLASAVLLPGLLAWGGWACVLYFADGASSRMILTLCYFVLMAAGGGQAVAQVRRNLSGSGTSARRSGWARQRSWFDHTRTGRFFGTLRALVLFVLVFCTAPLWFPFFLGWAAVRQLLDASIALWIS